MSKYLVIGLFVLSFQFSVGLVSAQTSTNEGRMRMKKIESIEDNKKREIVKDISAKVCDIKEKRLLESTNKLDGLTKTLVKYRYGRYDPDLIKKAQIDIANAWKEIETVKSINCTPDISSTGSNLRQEVKSNIADMEDKLRTVQTSVKKAALTTVEVMQHGKK